MYFICIVSIILVTILPLYANDIICTASCEKLDDKRLRIDRRLSNVERKMMKLSLNIMFGLTKD